MASISVFVHAFCAFYCVCVCVCTSVCICVCVGVSACEYMRVDNKCTCQASHACERRTEYCLTDSHKMSSCVCGNPNLSVYIMTGKPGQRRV